jgi:hypothetical protein
MLVLNTFIPTQLNRLVDKKRRNFSYNELNQSKASSFFPLQIKKSISFCSFTLFAHTSLIFIVMVTRKYTIVLFSSHTHSKKRYTQKTKYAKSYFQKKREERARDIKIFITTRKKTTE